MNPQDNCPLSWLSNDCLFYILNLCKHDWVQFPGDEDEDDEGQSYEETLAEEEHKQGNQHVLTGDYDQAVVRERKRERRGRGEGQGEEEGGSG